MNGRRRRQTPVRATLARPTRTGVQAGGGYIAAELVGTFVDLDGGQLALLGAGLTVLFAWVQVLVENVVGSALGRDVDAEVRPS